MTTETILTDDRLIEMAANELQEHFDRLPNSIFLFARAIEQAVLQSDHIRNMQGMADCMAMVRHELIEAGVINESVPPMMVANAVLAEIQALRKDAGRIDWLADPKNIIGNVQLPTVCVERNPHRLRDAIDDAMENKS